MRNWRKTTWVIVVVNILFLVWIIGGASSTAGSCEGLTGSELDACEAGTAIGAGIGIFMILVLWVIVDILLAIFWLVTNRTKSRECPSCGTDVKKGRTSCPKCNFDFSAAARGQHGPGPAAGG